MPCELFITAPCRTDAGDRCPRYKSEQDHQRFSVRDTVSHVQTQKHQETDVKLIHPGAIIE